VFFLLRMGLTRIVEIPNINDGRMGRRRAANVSRGKGDSDDFEVRLPLRFNDMTTLYSKCTLSNALVITATAPGGSLG
jgi:hypothetical protein